MSMLGDSKTSFTPSSHTGGILHRFTPQLTTFEHASSTSSASPSSSTNTLIFINGLYGRPLSTSYTQEVLPFLPPSWRLTEPLLSSAGKSFGLSSLTKDVSELAYLVAYLRTLRPQGRIVLLGHSTGCQDALHYLVAAGKQSRAPIDGVILQGPVSDRQALEAQYDSKELQRLNTMAKAMLDKGCGENCLPRKDSDPAYAGAPMTARRWLSMASPAPERRGEDDYFSSDLGRDRWRETFGRGGKGMNWLVFHGEKDQYVLDGVDRRTLVEEWKDAVLEGGGIWDGDGGVLPGADHALESCGDQVRADFGGKVARFLGGIESGKGEERL